MGNGQEKLWVLDNKLSMTIKFKKKTYSTALGTSGCPYSYMETNTHMYMCVHIHMHSHKVLTCRHIGTPYTHRSTFVYAHEILVCMCVKLDAYIHKCILHIELYIKQ